LKGALDGLCEERKVPVTRSGKSEEGNESVKPRRSVGKAYLEERNEVEDRCKAIKGAFMTKEKKLPGMNVNFRGKQPKRRGKRKDPEQKGENRRKSPGSRRFPRSANISRGFWGKMTRNKGKIDFSNNALDRRGIKR